MSEGTKFYIMDSDSIIENDKWINDNCWNIGLLTYYNLQDALNIDRMYGSGIVDDVLVFCVTDEEPVIINGEEENPTELLDNYSLDELDELVTNNVPKSVYEMITTFDLNFNGKDLESLGKKLLDDYSLEEVVNGAVESSLV